MKQLSLMFLMRHGEILLAMKKRGFGEGLWNGAGGKQQHRESINQTAIRETQEEIGVTAVSFDKVAELHFSYLEGEEMLVSAYLCFEWVGEPRESEEMKPRWFKIESIPYEKMWPDDKHWLPRVINGEKLKAKFSYDANNLIVDYALEFFGVL